MKSPPPFNQRGRGDYGSGANGLRKDSGEVLLLH
jgi:hypothetical protein